MEEVGTQVAAPLLIHQNVVGRYCEVGLIGKKRTHCYTSNQQLQTDRNGDGWKPKHWEWDSTHFVARVRSHGSHLLQISNPTVAPLDNSEGGVVDVAVRGPTSSKSSNSNDEGEQNDNSLQLQLGRVGSDSNIDGGNVQSSNSTEELATSMRPIKKVRPGSPGSGGSYPVCQVDDCTKDLSKSKDYHRRHKVCEVHSKVTKVVVAKQMQRFCQQCSRFHPLSEFDEGKRSCRRRLAGHNRQRRKTQPEYAISPTVHLTDNNSAGKGNLDIVNLLTVLARGQGNAENNTPNLPSLSKEQRYWRGCLH